MRIDRGERWLKWSENEGRAIPTAEGGGARQAAKRERERAKRGERATREGVSAFCSQRAPSALRRPRPSRRLRRPAARGPCGRRRPRPGRRGSGRPADTGGRGYGADTGVTKGEPHIRRNHRNKREKHKGQHTRSLESALAPPPSSALTQSACPPAAAWCNGVRPVRSRAEGSADMSRSADTTRAWPASAAEASGVRPAWAGGWVAWVGVGRVGGCVEGNEECSRPPTGGR